MDNIYIISQIHILNIINPFDLNFFQTDSDVFYCIFITEKLNDATHYETWKGSI